MKFTILCTVVLCAILLLPVSTVATFKQTKLLKVVKLPTSLLKKQGKKGTVILFFSPECPLCQSYTPTINKLIDNYRSQGIAFVGVVSGSSFNNNQINQYIKTYQSKLSFVLDNSMAIAQQFGATITPEVFLINTQQQIIYSGRIDNWAYEVGKKRALITAHNLNDAIVATLAQKPILVPQTKAIGCFIE